MTNPTDPAAQAPTSPSQPLQPPPKRGGGFFGRLIAALLVIIMTTMLTLTIVVLAYFWLGFAIDTPARVEQGRQRLDDQEVILADLQARNALLQTRVAEMDVQTSDSAETLRQLRAEIEAFNQVRQRLTEQLEAGARENATLVADMRQSRDAVLVFATAEADRAALIRDLKIRSERIERFLQRLSDISEDAALDLNQTPLETTPSLEPTLGASPSPSPTPEPAETPEPTTAPTETPEPTPTP
jgi:TolA-binding protein